MKDRDRIGVGIVGAGIMGAAHAATMAENPRARVVGVASLPRAPADRLAESLGADFASDDYSDLLVREDIDLICIATPDHLHADIAIAAAEAGKSLLIEKPLATNLADVDRIIDAVSTSNVKAMTSFNHRWIPSYAAAYEEMAEGRLGVPRMAYARKNDRIYVPTRMLTWASRTSPAWFLSSHDIDLVCWYLGETAIEVYASAVWGVLESQGIATPDAIQAQVRFDGGAVATFESCWIYPDTYPTMTDSFIEVVGTDGVVHLDRKSDQLEVATTEKFIYPRTSIMPTIHGRQGGALASAAAHMVDCLIEDRDPLVSLASSRHVTAILEAIHTSIETNVPAKVPA